MPQTNEGAFEVYVAVILTTCIGWRSGSNVSRRWLQEFRVGFVPGPIAVREATVDGGTGLK